MGASKLAGHGGEVGSMVCHWENSGLFGELAEHWGHLGPQRPDPIPPSPAGRDTTARSTSNVAARWPGDGHMMMIVLLMMSMMAMMMPMLMAIMAMMMMMMVLMAMMTDNDETSCQPPATCDPRPATPDP